MFEVGFTEIVLILGLALLILGPEKLPGLAQKVGRWTGRARSMARQLRTQLEQEVTLEEMAKSRPMQSGTKPPAPGGSATASQTPAYQTAESPSDFSAHSEPGLNEAAATPSVEPSETLAQSESVADAAATKAPQ